ncbi:hypothetical protein EFK24_27590, partial [Escherichia coli]|nr:hypothetical protein [Escherichia coli]
MSGLSSSAQKLTMAQIYVLRRMASGTVYDISGNFRGTVAKLAMRQPFVLFKGLTFQKLCLP